MATSLGELAVRFGLELVGDPDCCVERVATLAQAGPGALSFLANPKYRAQLAGTRASAVVLAAADVGRCPVPALVAGNPYAAYARIAQVLHPAAAPVAGVHASAVVAADAVLDATAEVGAGAVVESGVEVGPAAVIGPGCVLMQGVKVGAATRLLARVTVYPGTVIGQRCMVQAGAVLGADGFGFAPDQDGYVRIPQVGGLRIGDDVDIGANTTIDRGAIEDTVIGDGVKIDNLVQVGHNVRIGEHTVIAGCVGISGSATIGRRCMIGGKAGIAGHLEIGDDVAITGLTMVSRSLAGPGMYSSGWPALPTREWRRVVAGLRRSINRKDSDE